MNKRIEIERLFYKKNDSYEVVNTAKEMEQAGYKYVYANELVRKLSIRTLMFIVVTLAKEEYTINDTLSKMKDISNWSKDKFYDYYKFKLIQE